MPRTNIHIRFFSLTILLVMLYNVSFAQREKTIQQYINEGQNLSAKGNYTQALEHYNQALLLNGKHDQANYLMASTYYTLGKYPECVIHCDKAINIFSAYEEEAYMLKGQALLMNNKPAEALTNYNKMLSAFPGNHLIYYQIGLTYLKMGKLDEAERALAHALELKPADANSHLLLGNIMIKKGENLKAVMALTNFLLIEPRGKRAAETYMKLQKQLPLAFGNLGKDIPALSMAGDLVNNEFASTGAMLAAIETGTSKHTEEEWVSKHTLALFEILSSMKKESTFWWNFYVNFYNNMGYDKHIETLTHFISQSHVDESRTWIADNNQKVAQLIDWVNGYDR